MLAGTRVAADPVEVVPRISVGEQYNDNVFFTQSPVADYITSVSPGVSLEYRGPSLTLSLLGNTSMQFFARQTSQNNLAKTQLGTLVASYKASPRLDLDFSDRIARVGATRTDSGPNPTETAGEPSPADTVSTVLPRGDVFSNSFSASARYALDPRWSATALYSNGFGDFTNPNARDLRNSAGLHIGYSWSPTLSLRAAYSYTAFNVSRGTDTESQSVTVGAGYKYSPVWVATASAGVFVNRPLESIPGPSPSNNISTRVGPTFSLLLTRTFESSSASAGASQVITTSAGVAGVSITRAAFLSYDIELLESLAGSLSTSYSHFDTTQTTFNVLQFKANLSWPVWRRVRAGFSYSYRMREASQSVPNVLEAGAIHGNLVLVYISAYYPVWQGDL